MFRLFCVRAQSAAHGSDLLLKQLIANGRSLSERLQPWLIAGLFSVLLSMTVISTWIMTDLTHAAELDVKAYQTLSATLQVVMILLDGERAHRGYLESGEADDLRRYRQATERLDVQLERLQALGADDRLQRERIEALSAAAAAQLQDLHAQPPASGKGARDSAATASRRQRSEISWRSVYDPLASMQQAQQRLLEQRQQSAIRRRDAAQAVLWVLTVVALFAALATSRQFHQDVRQWRRAERELRFAAEHDHLTGLSNRREFEWMLGRRTTRAREDQTQFTLACIDVDRFKQINDALGHQVGDQILRAIGGRLRDQCRDDDMLARVGGEEFAILLHDLDAAGAGQIAERLRAGVAAQPIRYRRGGAGGEVPVTVSIGVATFPTHGQTPEKLMEAADQALYAAKDAGRNRVEMAAIAES